METIKDIVREALEDSTELLQNLGVLLGDDLTSKQICANNAVLAAPPEPIGNGAKMREALEEIFDCCKDSLGYNIAYVEDQARQALSAPARNCDRYRTLAAALDAWRDVDPREAGMFDDWLFAEAKGGAE